MMNQLESFAALLAERRFNPIADFICIVYFYLMCISFTAIQTVCYVELINQNDFLV